MRLSGTEWGWMNDQGRLGWTCFCHGLRCLNILCNTHSYPCNEDRCSCACPWKCRIWRWEILPRNASSQLPFVYASLHLGPPHSKVFSCRSINQSNQSLRWCSTPDQAAQLAGPSSERHSCLFRLFHSAISSNKHLCLARPELQPSRSPNRAAVLRHGDPRV